MQQFICVQAALHERRDAAGPREFDCSRGGGMAVLGRDDLDSREIDAALFRDGADTRLRADDHRLNETMFTRFVQRLESFDAARVHDSDADRLERGACGEKAMIAIMQRRLGAHNNSFVTWVCHGGRGSQDEILLAADPLLHQASLRSVDSRQCAPTLWGT